jgi:hypothetical protein
MFRAQINQTADGSILKMEGCLVAEWAKEAKSLMTSGPVPKSLIVDISDVSHIDSVGEQVLAWLASIGASFMAGGVYPVSVCERLRLPFYSKPNRSRKQP